jgi:Fe-S oxidoreductase
MSLQDFRPMMERCSNCSFCKWTPFDKIKSQRFGENCPSVCYYNFNTYSARGRFQLAQSILDNLCDYSDTVTEVIHACNTCGLCDVSCKVCRYNLEPLEHNIELKVSAVEKGKILPRQKEIMDTLGKQKTMLPGMLKANRLDWAKDLNLADVTKEKADIIFFPGCKYSYDKAFRNAGKTAVNIIKKAGIKVGTLGSNDNCCAGRALQMGFREEYTRSATANIAAIEKSGAGILVTPCSDCYHAFKRQYAKPGLKIKVLHVVEYLEMLIKEGKLKLTKPVPMTITYHDPCHFGRLGEEYIPWNGKEKKIMNQVHTWEPRRPRYSGANGIYDAPREVLKSIPGVKLVEMERIREYSWCCGAGGGCSETYPEFSTWTAGERITEANATGADALVTACPWCESNFNSAVDENGKKIKVLDIIDLVQQAI